MRFNKPALIGSFLVLGALGSAIAERGQQSPGEADVQSINKLAGMPLFADESLWDDHDASVAKRMKLRLEGRTKTQAGFRAYPAKETLYFGCRPSSVALYSENGKPTYASIVFINKGDFYAEHLGGDRTFQKTSPRNAPRMNELDRMFKKELEAEGDGITAAFTGLLGQHKRTTHGKGSSKSTERVNRWDWKGHAFILAATREQHVTLKIMPVAMADRQGRQEKKYSDSEMATLLKSRLERRGNGDVIVTEVPMVNQGPKGYCVPATWERYLRYMEIQADMYTLAMAGDTGKGGGTSTSTMSAAVDRIVSKNGRRIRQVKSPLSVRNISKFIDDGLPLMWQMKVVDNLNDEVTRRSRTRKKTTDWDAWIAGLEPLRKKARDLQRAKGGGHLCMIIGYNPKTQEIAISDSWGPSFAERWLTIEEAAAISSGSFYVITL